RAARACVAAALEALPRLGAAGLVPLVGAYADRYVDQGRTPADDHMSRADDISRAKENLTWPR
ncbi:hypothetical protein F8566_37835, partial [Actinomadura rudentiformis]